MKLVMHVLLFIYVAVAADNESILKDNIAQSCEKFKQSKYASGKEKNKKCSAVTKDFIRGVKARNWCSSEGHYGDWGKLLKEVPPRTSNRQITLYSGSCMQNFAKTNHTRDYLPVMLTFPGFLADDKNLTFCSYDGIVCDSSTCPNKSATCLKPTTKRFWEATSEKFVQEASNVEIRLSTEGFTNRTNGKIKYAFCPGSVLADVEIPKLTSKHQVAILLHDTTGVLGNCNDEPTVKNMTAIIKKRTGKEPACAVIPSKKEKNPCSVAALGRAASSSSYNYENEECLMDSRGVVNQVATAMLVGNMILSLIKP